MFPRSAVRPEKRVSDTLFPTEPGKPVLRGDALLMRRLADLYYDPSDASGSGSALASLTAAAAQIGSAVIIANAKNPTQVYPPLSTRPPYTVQSSSSNLALIAVVVVGVIVGAIYVMR